MYECFCFVLWVGRRLLFQLSFGSPSQAGGGWWRAVRCAMMMVMVLFSGGRGEGWGWVFERPDYDRKPAADFSCSFQIDGLARSRLPRRVENMMYFFLAQYVALLLIPAVVAGSDRRSCP